MQYSFRRITSFLYQAPYLLNTAQFGTVQVHSVALITEHIYGEQTVVLPISMALGCKFNYFILFFTKGNKIKWNLFFSCNLTNATLLFIICVINKQKIPHLLAPVVKGSAAFLISELKLQTAHRQQMENSPSCPALTESSRVQDMVQCISWFTYILIYIVLVRLQIKCNVSF